MINDQVTITYYNDKIMCLHEVGGTVIDMCLYDENAPQVKNIYIGKVDKIVKNIGAAFVKISPDITCFMKLDDVSDYHILNRNRTEADIKTGDELPVQISKPSKGEKNMVCTGRLSLTGKKPDEILALAKHRTCYSLIYSKGAGFTAFFNRFDVSLTERITCADEDLFEAVDAYLLKQNKEDIRNRLTVYNDDSYPLNKLCKVESLMSELKGRTVWLKSGANIVIDLTEAMTVIDVNTAKSIDDKSKDHILKINMEACDEAFRQVRLRNLSGMILIDFINDTEENTEILTRYIEDLCKKEPVSMTFVDITGLGISEITRKKSGITVYDV